MILRDYCYIFKHDNDISVMFSNTVLLEIYTRGFPGGAVVENPPANEGDTGSIPGLGRSHMPRSN